MPRLTIAEYAMLTVRLAASQRDPEELLTSAGLSLEQWDEQVAYWEDQLRVAMDRDDDVPELLLQYSEAVRHSLQSLSQKQIGLRTFSQILGQLRSGLPLVRVLQERGVALQDFLAAQHFWLQRAASDPEVRRALEETVP